MFAEDAIDHVMLVVDAPNQFPARLVTSRSNGFLRNGTRGQSPEPGADVRGNAMAAASTEG
jgi:hypothetical protein